MKKNFILQISDDTREELSKVASAAHMADTKFAAVWIEELSTVKPEFALKVLGLIPPDWKSRKPGRPSATSRAASQQHSGASEQQVA